MLTHTLRGEYESFTGSVDAIIRKQIVLKDYGIQCLFLRKTEVHNNGCILFMAFVATVAGGIGYISFSFAILEGADHNNLGDMVYTYVWLLHIHIKSAMM